MWIEWLEEVWVENALQGIVLINSPHYGQPLQGYPQHFQGNCCVNGQISSCRWGFCRLVILGSRIVKRVTTAYLKRVNNWRFTREDTQTGHITGMEGNRVNCEHFCGWMIFTRRQQTRKQLFEERSEQASFIKKQILTRSNETQMKEVNRIKSIEWCVPKH